MSRNSNSHIWKTLPVLTAKVLFGLHRGAKSLEPYAFLLAAIGVLMAAITLLLDLDDRTTERKIRAWQVIIDTDPSQYCLNNNLNTTSPINQLAGKPYPAQTSPLQFSSVYRESLAYLSQNFDGWLCHDLIKSVSNKLTGNDKRRCIFPKRYAEPLTDVCFPSTILSGVDLTGAVLSKSIFDGTNFSGADLSNAIFDHSSFKSAVFIRSDLTNAKFIDTQMDGVILVDATLDHADFAGSSFGDALLRDASFRLTNLSGADLSDARGMTQEQLDSACATPPSPPKVPTGLNWNKQDCDFMIWRGLRVLPEVRCTKYNRKQYVFSARDVRSRLPRDAGNFSPYTNLCLLPGEKKDLDHIVAIVEAHDSGLCSADRLTRERFVNDMNNIVVVEPKQNRKKAGKDAAEWFPEENRCWFANKVVEVKAKYELTIDHKEMQALEEILRECVSGDLQTPSC